jgi:hypothetical protein
LTFQAADGLVVFLPFDDEISTVRLSYPASVTRKSRGVEPVMALNWRLKAL